MSKYECIDAEDSLIFKLYLPGYWKNEIKVEAGEMRGLVLERNSQNPKIKDKNAKLLRIFNLEDDPKGDFTKLITFLKEDVPIYKILAEVNNDMLTVVVPENDSSPLISCMPVDALPSTFKDWPMDCPQINIFKINAPWYNWNEVSLFVEEGTYLAIIEEQLDHSLNIFQLTNDMKVDQIRTSMANDVFTVVIPKGTPQFEFPKIFRIPVWNNKL